MRGGSLTRYHTPVLTKQEGKGLAEDLIKLAGPLIVQQAQAGLQDIQRGKSAAATWADRSAQLSRGLKRKAPAMASQDERGDDFWQVHPQTSKSFGVPIGVDPDKPRTQKSGAGPTPYERGHVVWPGGSQEGVVGQSSQSQEAERGQRL